MMRIYSNPEAVFNIHHSSSAPVLRNTGVIKGSQVATGSVEVSQG